MPPAPTVARALSRRDFLLRRLLPAAGIAATLPALRTTVAAAGPGAAAAGQGAATRPASPEDGPFRLDPLPYPEDALAPVIDAETMSIHHGRHHAGYVRALNQAVAGLAVPASVEALIADLSIVPAAVRTAVRNNGGGHANHAFFWSIMTRPDRSPPPSGALLDAINASCGSLEQMKRNFTSAALTRFGSGWAWLLVTPDGGLTCTSTPNQDSPLMGDAFVDVPGTPILGLDVWEHAYYLNYRNRRADYVEAFFRVVNWNEVARRYRDAHR